MDEMRKLISEKRLSLEEEMAMFDDVREMLDDRAQRYGAFPDHALFSQGLKRVLMSSPKWESLSFAQRESLEMICHKIARIMNGDPDYRDNWDDIAGYATLVSDELKRQEVEARRQTISGMTG